MGEGKFKYTQMFICWRQEIKIPDMIYPLRCTSLGSSIKDICKCQFCNESLDWLNSKLICTEGTGGNKQPILTQNNIMVKNQFNCFADRHEVCESFSVKAPKVASKFDLQPSQQVK